MLPSRRNTFSSLAALFRPTIPFISIAFRTSSPVEDYFRLTQLLSSCSLVQSEVKILKIAILPVSNKYYVPCENIRSGILMVVVQEIYEWVQVYLLDFTSSIQPKLG